MSGMHDSEGMSFSVVKNAVEGAARVGRLVIPKRQSLDTPNFFGMTSRGAAPHITPDNLARHTQLAGVYMPLEDFIETSVRRPVPHIYKAPSATNGTLNAFTATPSSVATIIAPRRHPAVTAPMGNGREFVSINTSMGFRQLTTEAYCQAVDTLRPDITIPLADLTYGYEETKQKFSTSKRQLRMVERTEDWLSKFFKSLPTGEDGKPEATHVFAPLLPVPYSIQWDYLNTLVEEHLDGLSGLAVYDTNILPDLEDYKSLQALPRLSLDFLVSPQEILRQTQLGVDMFTVPFINTTSDSGIALSFSFPPPAPDATAGTRPLGIDMSSQDHQVSLEPLKEGCPCYACTKHHRAYLHHLLSVREMLGWTLLQIHNHQVVSDFFAGIRSTIAAGQSIFDENVQLFSRVYESELPKGTGERPRARGYHFKSEGGQPKINQPAWEKYGAENREDPVVAAELAGLAATGPAAGGSETPVIPKEAFEDLNKKGFANADK